MKENRLHVLSVF